jgi:hypothetical protein
MSQTGNNIMLFSNIREANGKTIKQNNMEKIHNIPIGALVEVKYDKWLYDGACMKIHARLWVIEHGRDCDGTPLYSLANRPLDKWEDTFIPIVRDYFYGVEHGFSEESLKIIEVTDRLKKGYDSLKWENDE